MGSCCFITIVRPYKKPLYLCCICTHWLVDCVLRPTFVMNGSDIAYDNFWMIFTVTHLGREEKSVVSLSR